MTFFHNTLQTMTPFLVVVGIWAVLVCMACVIVATGKKPRH